MEAITDICYKNQENAWMHSLQTTARHNQRLALISRDEGDLIGDVRESPQRKSPSERERTDSLEADDARLGVSSHFCCSVVSYP